MSKFNLLRNDSALLRSVHNSDTHFFNLKFQICTQVHNVYMLDRVGEHSESDWHRSSRQFSIWFQGNSYILETPRIVVKISSVRQNIKPNIWVSVRKSYVYIMHLRKAFFLKLTFLINVAELKSNLRPWLKILWDRKGKWTHQCIVITS